MRKNALHDTEGPIEPGWYAMTSEIAHTGPFSDPKDAWRAIRRPSRIPIPGDMVFYSDGILPAKPDRT